MLAPIACGHRWVTDPPTHDHHCHRTGENHRTHECACSAVELRTAPYTRAASVVDGGPPPAWAR
jgi:hypothetical protein